MSIWIIYLFAYDWDDPFHYNAKFYFPTEKEAKEFVEANQEIISFGYQRTPKKYFYRELKEYNEEE